MQALRVFVELSNLSGGSRIGDSCADLTLCSEAPYFESTQESRVESDPRSALRMTNLSKRTSGFAAEASFGEWRFTPRKAGHERVGKLPRSEGGLRPQRYILKLRPTN